MRKHEENRNRLRVPRRPPWTKAMTVAEVDRQEKTAFLDWRRGLAVLQEQEKLLLTPFERNIEVWRQLWRVLERSHLVVQIVDARNPLRFRCEDLESYVLDVEGNEGEAGTGKDKRRNLLLINKADLLTIEQRRHWADYFEREKIEYAFYSAANAVAQQHVREELTGSAIFTPGATKQTSVAGLASSDISTSLKTGDVEQEGQSISETDTDTDVEDAYFSADEQTEYQDPRLKILTVVELEDLFLKKAPNLSVFSDSSGERPSKLTVGLVGYPNVGKSSTINSLLGEKKVSVSSTPGKTKHFQTIHLSDSIILCDCPGLVFPQFATTKADLVCDGVLPIDQLREYTGPTTLVVKRVPKEVLEATYGLSLKVRSIEEGGVGQVTADTFLKSYAVARGFMRSGQGNPDESRAARYLLKDYVNGKILFCHPPPDISPDDFNKKTHALSLTRAIKKKWAPATRVVKHSNTFVALESTGSPTNAPLQRGTQSQAIDNTFFGTNLGSYRPHVSGSSGRHGEEFTRPKSFPHQNIIANDGTALDPYQARREMLLNNAGLGKKHHRKVKQGKQRSGRGYDDWQ
ncbi:hypothetical protein AX17_000743 [Amanita inopinata Kibby_2008]|nr:hypothetical protein AX17_000743 [Amanita inopinata Kibby_2008]